jgi:type II secretory pathway component PulC
MTMRMWCAALALVLCACTTAKPKEEEQILYTPPAGEEALRPEVPAGPSVMEGPAAPPITNEPPTQPAPPVNDAMTVKREELRMLQQRGPAFLLAQVQVQPVKDTSGKFAGYAIQAFTPEAKQRLTPALALGDVITHLNGIRMKRPEDYMAAWKLLSNASEVRIDFLRADQPSTVIWTVEP